MAENSNEEIDLGLVFKKLGDFYKNLLIAFYKGVQFVVINWYIFLILIAAGIALGYFKDKNAVYSKETSIIVQINFGGSNYVYNAIDQLNYKIKQNEASELEALGFSKDEKTLIRHVEIEPIVNIVEILKKVPNSGRNMDVLLETSQFEDDLLTTEIFTSEYSSHRILMTISGDADESIVTDLINYLNGNEILNSVKAVTVENTKRKIASNIRSIAYMDSIFKTLGSKTGVNREKDQIYFNNFGGGEQSGIHLVFREKRSIQNEIQLLEIELLKYNNIVETLNRPELRTKKNLLSSKKRVYPILFVFVFLIGSFILNVYRKAKSLNAEKQVKE